MRLIFITFYLILRQIYGIYIMSKRYFLFIIIFVFFRKSSAQETVVIPCMVYGKPNDNENLIRCDKVLAGFQEAWNVYSKECLGCFTPWEWQGYNKIYPGDDSQYYNIRQKYNAFLEDLTYKDIEKPKREACYFAIAQITSSDDMFFTLSVTLLSLYKNNATKIGLVKIHIQSKKDNDEYINMIRDSILNLFKRENALNELKLDKIKWVLMNIDSINNQIEQYIVRQLQNNELKPSEFAHLGAKISQDDRFHQYYFEIKLNYLVKYYEEAKTIIKKWEYRLSLQSFMNNELLSFSKQLSPSLHTLREVYTKLKIEKDSMSSEIKSKIDKDLAKKLKIIKSTEDKKKEIDKSNAEKDKEDKKLNEKLMEAFIEKIRMPNPQTDCDIILRSDNK